MWHNAYLLPKICPLSALFRVTYNNLVILLKLIELLCSNFLIKGFFHLVFTGIAHRTVGPYFSIDVQQDE